MRSLKYFQALRRISYSGDWRLNENNYCFGKRLNAPGDGKVIEVVNTIDDNYPGNVNKDQPGGNYIIINHLNGETSILAHLKKGSIIVAIGDTVVKGQEVGKLEIAVHQIGRTYIINYKGHQVD